MHALPELLMPAGSLEKLKVAILYGADAVYLGGQKYGLRAASDNFTEHEIKQAVEFAHDHGAKVYITLNSFFHDEDFVGLAEFLNFLSLQRIDALIVSDLGVLSFVREHCSLPIHLSTQASCLNSGSAQFWKHQGVKRLILGREVSVAEAGAIKAKTGLEVELFIHGSMCMAYSGNCTISNYTQGRDSNRGGCAHSCRFEYELNIEQERKKAFFMSSKDLAGASYLPEFVSHQIDSVKVEGRMKGHNYAGSVAKIYREALDQMGSGENSDLGSYQRNLSRMSNRGYTTASLGSPAGMDSIENPSEASEQAQTRLVGLVMASDPNQGTLVQVRKSFDCGDQLELVPFRGPSQFFSTKIMNTLAGEKIARTRPNSLVVFPHIPEAKKFNVLRMGESCK